MKKTGAFAILLGLISTIPNALTLFKIEKEVGILTVYIIRSQFPDKRSNADFVK